MLVTRIAPTPSGYLHEGNAVNFVLTAWLAAQHQGRLLLRVDDMDATRVRPEYLADVFRVLDWLDISIDEGPSGVDEFYRDYSMANRTEDFRKRLATISDNGGHLFACTCSRSALRSHDRYPGTCRTAGLNYEEGRSAIRIAAPVAMGDFVVWRRDDLPSYQLASVVADADLGVTHVIRGADLAESTEAQVFLAPLAGAPSVAAIDFRQHGLLRAPDGSKLSKSAGRQGTSIVGDERARQRIMEIATALAPEIGVTPR